MDLGKHHSCESYIIVLKRKMKHHDTKTAHIKVVSDIYVLTRFYEVPGKEMQHRKNSIPVTFSPKYSAAS